MPPIPELPDRTANPVRSPSGDTPGVVVDFLNPPRPPLQTSSGGREMMADPIGSSDAFS